MTVKLTIGPKEKTNQETDPRVTPSFIKLIKNGPYSDPSSRNYGHMSDQFFIGWIKRACMRKYFLKDGSDEFIEKNPVGQYLVTIGFVKDLKLAAEYRLMPAEKELTLWLLEWIENFKGKPDLIIELR